MINPTDMNISNRNFNWLTLSLNKNLNEDYLIKKYIKLHKNFKYAIFQIIILSIFFIILISKNNYSKFNISTIMIIIVIVWLLFSIFYNKIYNFFNLKNLYINEISVNYLKILIYK